MPTNRLLPEGPTVGREGLHKNEISAGARRLRGDLGPDERWPSLGKYLKNTATSRPQQSFACFAVLSRY